MDRGVDPRVMHTWFGLAPSRNAPMSPLASRPPLGAYPTRDERHPGGSGQRAPGLFGDQVVGGGRQLRLH
jgi:hypothetical protein